MAIKNVFSTTVRKIAVVASGYIQTNSLNNQFTSTTSSYIDIIFSKITKLTAHFNIQLTSLYFISNQNRK
ncbi:MAG: hypothetical protein AABZ74_15955, partial [Cyanobacteriota bacterium]